MRTQAWLSVCWGSSPSPTLIYRSYGFVQGFNLSRLHPQGFNLSRPQIFHIKNGYDNGTYNSAVRNHSSAWPVSKCHNISCPYLAKVTQRRDLRRPTGASVSPGLPRRCSDYGQTSPASAPGVRSVYGDTGWKRERRWGKSQAPSQLGEEGEGADIKGWAGRLPAPKARWPLSGQAGHSQDNGVSCSLSGQQESLPS